MLECLNYLEDQCSSNFVSCFSLILNNYSMTTSNNNLYKLNAIVNVNSNTRSPASTDDNDANGQNDRARESENHQQYYYKRMPAIDGISVPILERQQQQEQSVHYLTNGQLDDNVNAKPNQSTSKIHALNVNKIQSNRNNNNNNNNTKDNVQNQTMGQKNTKSESNQRLRQSNQNKFQQTLQQQTTASYQQQQTTPNPKVKYSNTSKGSSHFDNDATTTSNNRYNGKFIENEEDLEANEAEKETIHKTIPSNTTNTTNSNYPTVRTTNDNKTEILRPQRVNMYNFRPAAPIPLLTQYNHLRYTPAVLEDVIEVEHEDSIDNDNDDDDDDNTENIEDIADNEDDEDDEEYVDVSSGESLDANKLKTYTSTRPPPSSPPTQSPSNTLINLESNVTRQQTDANVKDNKDRSKSRSCSDSGIDDTTKDKSPPHHYKLPNDRNNQEDYEDLLLSSNGIQEPLNPNERLICIESISLPDVVVQSTNSNSSNSSNHSIGSPTSINDDILKDKDNSDCDIININSGAVGNITGNVHFIPIHIEGQTRQRHDRIGVSSQATIQITEDATEIQNLNSPGHQIPTNQQTINKLRADLLEEKSKLNEQMQTAERTIQKQQIKLNEMQMKINKLEEDLSTKSWNVEKLQGELLATQKDDEYVRKKLKLVEDEKTKLRQQYNDKEDEFKRKFDELEHEEKSLGEQFKESEQHRNNLQKQLQAAELEITKWQQEAHNIRNDMEEQIRILKNMLENSENERKICADKWQREFEMLRTHNMEHEESIMSDCEWQLRQMQKQFKEKFDKVNGDWKTALQNAEQLEEELEQRCKEIDDLRIFESQVKSLRGVVTEQEHSIQTLMAQIEKLKAELHNANEHLQQQEQTIQQIQIKCERALGDKERELMYRIDEVRHNAAAFWEEKLYTELSRLKNELESVYVEERRDALNKLQMEHIEELRAITNRYTTNEEELRTELNEVQDQLETKTSEFLQLREKSDNALLQTRMHLERADHDYQVAMCREEEKREALEQSLREEFASEKLVIEEKFKNQTKQIEQNFNKKLQQSKHDLNTNHQKEINQIKAKLLAEKESALQELADNHRTKLAEVEEKIKETELQHKADLKDLKAMYDAEKVATDKRDINNANEIDLLHRKCRCLTNLFEEMRMRYERRDPRPEDLREIAELRNRCESQERDLYLLTDRLREMQNQMDALQGNPSDSSPNKKGKQQKKPPLKAILTNCDVIYEENEESESLAINSNNALTLAEQNLQLTASNIEEENPMIKAM